MGKIINMKAYIHDENKIFDVITVDYVNGTIKYYDDNKNCLSTNLSDNISILLGTGIKDVNNKEVFEGDILERSIEPIGDLSIVIRETCSNSLFLKRVVTNTLFSLDFIIIEHNRIVGNVFMKPNDCNKKRFFIS